MVIGLDESFLNGSCKGQLLSTVDKNSNQKMFSIARVIVGRETKHSWTCFLQHLIKDLELADGEGLTIMSDMHKVTWLFYL